MARRSPSSRASQGGLLRLAERTGINRGIFGGSKGWFYVGTSLWTLRTVRRLAQRKPEVLLSEELRPGQRLIIANGRATIEDAAPGTPLVTIGSARKRRRRSS